MASEETLIEMAAEARLVHRSSGYDPAASQPVEAFRSRAAPSGQYSANDIQHGGVLREAYQNSAQVIAKNAVIFIRLRLQVFDGNLRARHFAQSPVYQVGLAAEEII